MAGAEAALQHFKREVWEGSGKAARRDELKAQLHDAYATAKELGEIVELKRRSVAQLRQALQGGEAAEGQEEEALRLRLQLDTAAYKDAVGQLRELKPRIGGLQEQMQRAQAHLEAEFAAWHAKAMATARAGAKTTPRGTPRAGGGGVSACGDRTNNHVAGFAAGAPVPRPRYVGIC